MNKNDDYTGQVNCTWTEDEEGCFLSDCGELFELGNEDGPITNGMRFCCFCGGVMQEVLWTGEIEDDENN